MKNTKFTGMVMATAVVGLLASGYGLASGGEKGETTKSVKCAGINSCKGHGECGAADGGSHACAGKNECKGKGWVKVASEKECTDKGGTVVKEEKKG